MSKDRCGGVLGAKVVGCSQVGMENAEVVDEKQSDTVGSLGGSTAGKSVTFFAT